MRIAVLVLAATLGVTLGACATGAAGMPAPAAQTTDQIPEAVLPDYKPETAAACNAVRLSVELAKDGSIKVNGAAADMDKLKAAAAAKNAACGNAPAMVGYAVAAGVPAKQRDAVRDVLSTGIVNLALVEVATE